MDESLFTISDNTISKIPTLEEEINASSSDNINTDNYIPNDDYPIDRGNTLYDEVDVLDVEWVTNSFMIKPSDLIFGKETAKDAKIYKDNRFASLVDQQFTDTSLGGSLSINVVPQLTRYADIRSGGILSGRRPVTVTDMNGNYGLGRYYGEVYEENSTDVYMELGFTRFNNTLFYLFSSVDYKTAVVANSGRSPLMYNAGLGLGYGALMLAFPFITLGILLVKGIATIGANLLANPGRFEHSYLHPQMFTYWSMVNTLSTMMFTELGVVMPTLMDNKQPDANRIGAPMQISQDELDVMRDLMPGLITTGNAINIHAMLARGQMLHIANRKRRLKALNSLDYDLNDENVSLYRKSIELLDKKIKPTKDIWSKLKPYIVNNKEYKELSKEAVANDLKEMLAKVTDKTVDIVNDMFSMGDDGTYNREARGDTDEVGNIKKAMNVAETVFNEGARYAVFRVQHIGSTTETFSNSTTSISLDDSINSKADSWRDIKFSLGGGEIPGVSSVITGIQDLIVGTTEGLTMGLTNVIAGFLAGAKLESKKRWEGSSVSLPTHTFKMTLRSPSAHPIAQLQNLYIPLAAILATVLPISTGPKSYTSPLNCNMFVRGLQRIEHGMVAEVSVTRGVSNLAYNRSRRTLALDVTFKVVDYSETVSAAISSDILSSGSIFYNDEAGINRYIQSLCARDLFSATHTIDRAKIKISKFWQETGLLMTPEFIGAKLGDAVASDTIFGIFANDKTVKYSELFK